LLKSSDRIQGWKIVAHLPSEKLISKPPLLNTPKYASSLELSCKCQ
jgi:hypothetical protein